MSTTQDTANPADVYDQSLDSVLSILEQSRLSQSRKREQLTFMIQKQNILLGHSISGNLNSRLPPPSTRALGQNNTQSTATLSVPTSIQPVSKDETPSNRRTLPALGQQKPNPLIVVHPPKGLVVDEGTLPKLASQSNRSRLSLSHDSTVTGIPMPPTTRELSPQRYAKQPQKQPHFSPLLRPIEAEAPSPPQEDKQFRKFSVAQLESSERDLHSLRKSTSNSKPHDKNRVEQNTASRSKHRTKKTDTQHRAGSPNKEVRRKRVRPSPDTNSIDTEPVPSPPKAHSADVLNAQSNPIAARKKKSATAAIDNFKKEIKQEIKDEIKDEIKNELKEEIVELIEEKEQSAQLTVSLTQSTQPSLSSEHQAQGIPLPAHATSRGRNRQGAFMSTQIPKFDADGNCINKGSIVQMPADSYSVTITPKGGVSVTGKHVSPNYKPSKLFSVAMSQTIGKRPYNEDRMCYFQDVDHSGQEWEVFGVFDGHNGKDAAEIASQIVLKCFFKALEKKKKMKNAIELCFDLLHKQIVKKTQSGTTATVLFANATHMFVANCGDSPCFVSKNKTFRMITETHNCSNAEEVQRIEQVGGTVVARKDCLRVNGIIAVTRTLGDRSLDTVLSHKPFITKRRLSDVRMVVVCSDGLTDVVNEQHIQDMMSKLSNVDSVANGLRDKAYECDSQDNISVLTLKVC